MEGPKMRRRQTLLTAPIMGLPLYRSPSSEALRRQLEAANQAASQQQQPDPRRARSGAPPPPLRREDAQRLFSQSPFEAAAGTRERPIDLTRRSLEVEALRRPAPPSRFEAPLPSTEGEESDTMASAVLSRYSRTSLDSSESATPAEEEELRLPDYGTPDMDWSTPEIEAASTPPRPEAQDSSTAAPHQPQQRQQQQQAGLAQAASRQQERQASDGGRGGFVQVVVSQDSGLAQVHVQGRVEGQVIPPSRRLPPPLPRPSDATIRGARRQRLGQSAMSTQSTGSTTTSSQGTGCSGSRSPRQSSRVRRGN
ncbi:hypothetical protein GE21DRAFT_4995 [Neurospora crassa]|uniref:Uncharacterized protein n=1 Tax=Neurospora crassa (strain ATCC 24698 / 74-OR23-1A / CBS 708.71 / DSM 1257 / FGSC 987) TaxID=367110 RepID=A7UWH2_NEUCR|nr:hypothetical protein NCU10210 [Neurospora crassa OR74A]EDO65183.2 hypothetical protein NCU10210 [Neurospora crassa OR74A]KHE86461.1 hypothetical protein GE21DRAFT_4995 [Neurospora crassa]|eukprot:XP_001728274.2 hypothetical protein NCU10210 [Neurospora crassa OR74A]